MNFESRLNESLTILDVPSGPWTRDQYQILSLAYECATLIASDSTLTESWLGDLFGGLGNLFGKKKKQETKPKAHRDWSGYGEHSYVPPSGTAPKPIIGKHSGAELPRKDWAAEYPEMYKTPLKWGEQQWHYPQKQFPIIPTKKPKKQQTAKKLEQIAPQQSGAQLPKSQLPKSPYSQWEADFESNPDIEPQGQPLGDKLKPLWDKTKAAGRWARDKAAPAIGAAAGKTLGNMGKEFWSGMKSGWDSGSDYHMGSGWGGGGKLGNSGGRGGSNNKEGGKESGGTPTTSIKTKSLDLDLSDPTTADDHIKKHFNSIINQLDNSGLDPEKQLEIMMHIHELIKKRMNQFSKKVTPISSKTGQQTNTQTTKTTDITPPQAQRGTFGFHKWD